MSSQYIWPLSKSSTPDQMNTSFGPRINVNKWDFHDGIDLPAPIGTEVFAMQAGKVFRAGRGEPATSSKVIHSRHVIIETEGVSGEKIYLVYLHLDSIAPEITVGADVSQKQAIGTVGEDDASYPHLHFEFRKGSSLEKASVHPLNYLPYIPTKNFKDPVLDRFNRSHMSIAVRLTFEGDSRLQGDLQGVEVHLSLEGSPRTSKFDDKRTVNEGNGDDLRFNSQDVAVEGYQKSNMIKDGRTDLHYGILVRNVPLACHSFAASLFDVSGKKIATNTLQCPEDGLVDVAVDFENDQFPPQDWTVSTSGSGTSVKLTCSAAYSGERGMECVAASRTETTLKNACIERALPQDRFEWLSQAWLNPKALTLEKNQSVLLFRFTDGEALIAAAHINRGSEKLWAGITVRKLDGTLKSSNGSAAVEINRWRNWSLHLLRLGTRETTAILSLDSKEVVRLNWDTVGVQLLGFAAGIASIPAKASGTISCDELRLTEDTLSSP